MATTNNSEHAAFPLAKGYSRDARAARVDDLREQVRSGAYRLDPGSVARTLLESGAIAPATAGTSDTSPEALRQAMARFVVARSRVPEDGRRSTAV